MQRGRLRYHWRLRITTISFHVSRPSRPRIRRCRSALPDPCNKRQLLVGPASCSFCSAVSLGHEQATRSLDRLSVRRCEAIKLNRVQATLRNIDSCHRTSLELDFALRSKSLCVRSPSNAGADLSRRVAHCEGLHNEDTLVSFPARLALTRLLEQSGSHSQHDRSFTKTFDLYCSIALSLHPPAASLGLIASLVHLSRYDVNRQRQAFPVCRRSWITRRFLPSITKGGTTTMPGSS